MFTHYYFCKLNLLLTLAMLVFITNECSSLPIKNNALAPINPTAVANTPWLNGSIIMHSPTAGLTALGIVLQQPTYRVFLGLTEHKQFIVQDFFTHNSAKRSDPYLIANIESITQTFEQNPSIEGHTIFWYDNGIKQSEGYYTTGLKQGIWQEWYDNGQIENSITFIDGQGHGPAIFWYENGQKYLQGNYLNSRMEGVWESWDIDGHKISEIHYANGILHGKKWTEEPQLYPVNLYCEEQWGEDEILHSCKNRQGWVRSESNYEHGLLSGTVIDYDVYGQIRYSGQYQNGKPHGTSTWWYANGNKKEQITYSNGSKNGIWRTWDATGTPEKAITYQNDTQNGPAQWWYSNGALQLSGNYHHGQWNGLFIGYERDGRISSLGHYRNGRKIGLWRYWNHQRQLIEKIENQENK